MHLRLLAPVVVVAAALALTGCVAEPGTAPSISAPGATRSTSSTPTPTRSGATPTATTSASPTPDAGFTTRELADVCITGVQESGAGTGGASANPRASEARSQRRADGSWAVAVPVTITSAGQTTSQAAYFCTLTGTRDNFQLELRAETQYTVADDWAQVLKALENGTR